MPADAEDANLLQKAKFGKVIKKKFAGLIDTSDDRIHEITMELMHRIDLDHSGQIDYQEFYEFFANNDEFVVSNENIRAMFLEFDNGNLSTEKTINAEELAKAIKSALTLAVI
jgi:Ca2+-binding EF-hand superfamily protein